MNSVMNPFRRVEDPCRPILGGLRILELRTRSRSIQQTSELRYPTPPAPTPTMRWSNLLTASLLPFTALAARKSSGDRFNDFRAQSSSSPLTLDDPKYAQLTKAPRDYSVAVLLTAMGARFGCQLCREFQPEWELLAKSWSKGDRKGESRLLYGTLDFEDGKNTFQSVCRLAMMRNYTDNLCVVDAPDGPGCALLSPHYRTEREGGHTARSS